MVSRVVSSGVDSPNVVLSGQMGSKRWVVMCEKEMESGTKVRTSLMSVWLQGVVAKFGGSTF